MSTRKVNGLRGATTEEHTASKTKVYTSFPQADVTADSPSTDDPARGFIITDLGTGTTVEYTDAGNVTSTVTATAIVGAFWPCAVRSFTANTDVGEIVVFF